MTYWTARIVAGDGSCTARRVEKLQDHSGSVMKIEPNAGIDLDQLVAHKVMGWHQCGRCKGWYETSGEGEFQISTGCAPLPSFSTDIAAAWQVVEKLGGLALLKVDDGWMVGDLSNGYTHVLGYVEGNLVDFATAETAPLAICLAALQAVESRHA